LGPFNNAEQNGHLEIKIGYFWGIKGRWKGADRHPIKFENSHKGHQNFSIPIE